MKNVKLALAAVGLITVTTIGIVVSTNDNDTVSQADQERVFQEAWAEASEEDKEGTCLAILLMGEGEVTRLLAEDLPAQADAGYMVSRITEECSK